VKNINCVNASCVSRFSLNFLVHVSREEDMENGVESTQRRSRPTTSWNQLVLKVIP
jgi:hypothetical protein